MGESEHGTSKSRVRPSKSVKYCVVVIELDETLPRRDQSKPHLYIAVSASLPDDRLSELKRGKGPKFAVGHYVDINNGESDIHLSLDLVEARKLLKKVKLRYAENGHAVNGASDEWRVYVINLKQDHLKTPSLLGHVYVGSTWKKIETRIAEHSDGGSSKKGTKINSTYVTKYFNEQNNELTLKDRFYTRRSAERREKTYAEELRHQGYLVRAGNFTPSARTPLSKSKNSAE